MESYESYLHLRALVSDGVLCLSDVLLQGELLSGTRANTCAGQCIQTETHKEIEVERERER